MPLYNTHANFVPANTNSKLLHTGAGKAHAIIVTGADTTADSLTLYDNTLAAGDVLIKINVSLYAPVTLHLDRLLSLQFSKGLTAVTSAGASAFVLTEA